MNIQELKEALDRAGVNPDRYDLDGGIPRRSEGLVLVRDGHQWTVRHFERGSWYTLRSFAAEEPACRTLLEYASDAFYRT